MCIAIYKPLNRVLKDHVITNSYYNNSDGAGFAAWTPEDGLVVKKGFFTLAEFLEAYEPYSGNGDKKAIALLHFRIATHGPINEDNCHPFVVECSGGYKVAVIHNGVIGNLSGYDTKSKSDTAHFVEAVLAPAIKREPKIWLNPAFQHVVENLIGWSKLALIDSDGNVALYNQESGLWDSDCWLSNSSYQYIYRSVRSAHYSVGDYDNYSGVLPYSDTQGGSYGGDKSACGTKTSSIVVKENGKRYTWEEWLKLKDKTVEKLQERGESVDADTFPFGHDDVSEEAEVLSQIAQEIAEAEATGEDRNEGTEVVTGSTPGTQLALIDRDNSPFLSRASELEGSLAVDSSERTITAAAISTLEGEGGIVRDAHLRFEACFCRMCVEYREIYNIHVTHSPMCECSYCEQFNRTQESDKCQCLW